MALSTAGSLLVMIGWGCRWAVYRARVVPPRRFGVAQRGWWLPPLPAAGEFATGDARRLEGAGRALVLAGVVALLTEPVGRRLAA
jgi:hypothetical protein